MGKYTLECKMCGKYFENYNKTTSFCSRDCYRKYMEKNGKCKDVICPICKTKFKQKRPEQVFVVWSAELNPQKIKKNVNVNIVVNYFTEKSLKC